MGCASSKLDDLPAVSLCRERCAFLDEAIRQRFVLAESHFSYIRSLKTVGGSLYDFIERGGGGGGGSFPSPKLNLPPLKKGDPVKISGDEAVSKKLQHGGGGGGDVAAVHHSHSNSGGHLQFNSDSDHDHLHDVDDEDDDDVSSVSQLHHSGHASPPMYQYGGGRGGGGGGGGDFQYVSSDYRDFFTSGGDGGGGGGGGIFHTNYMKKQTTPSNVVYEQRPVSHETVHFAESSNYDYFGSQNYYGGGGGGGGGAMRGYYGGYPYGSSSSPVPGPGMGMSSASTSKPPPPPPSPPRASAWEFLNPFESYEKFYPQYTPSRDSKELREEEGIPDLEDEYNYPEVVKQVHGDSKYVDGNNAGLGGSNYAKSLMMDDGGSADGRMIGENPVQASVYEARPSGVSMENDRMEYEVHVVDKKVVGNDGGEEHGGGGGFKGPLRDVLEVAFEIKVQFERASEFGNEIAKMLEVGTVPHHRKYASKMLHGVPSSLPVVSSQPSTSKSAEASSSAEKHIEIDEDLMIRSKNLSSTLQKLYLWEKKLYEEVKAEEKMRVIHERKVRKLKSLDERGAEAHKVDATRTFIRSLSTKIRMAIQVVDRISITINKIRDEELWPQLNALIEGLTRMWKNMLECHHSQCQAIREARSLGPIGSGKKLSDAHLEATLQLERELLNWTYSFSSWVGAQKGYVRALNNWLVKCLLYEPEETADGIVPFSPGRIGAPPVFVICNQWAQAMDRISENEVIHAMRIFAMSVLQLWEQDKQEMQQRMMTNKDMERKVRNLDREDQKIQKEVQALDKKIVTVAGDGNNLLLTGNIVYQSDTKNSSLHGSLQRIFEAMERFMADSMKAYEELLQRAEEERLAREHERVS